MTKGKFMLRSIGYHRRYEKIHVNKKIWYMSKDLSEFGNVKQTTPEQGKLII